jgi:hypothetical protein
VHSLLEGCVVSDVLFARRGWGGSGSCGILRWCRLRFGRRDLASSFFPCEFFNAPVALGFVQCRLLAGDFSAPASDCCPLPYSLDDRWGVVCTGERGGGFPTSGCAFGLVSVAFSVCGQRGGRGGFPSSRCDFWVGVSCFSVRGPAPSFPWECFVVVATLGSSSVDFCQAISPPRRPNSVACTHRGVSVRRWTWFFQGQIGGGFPIGGCAYG